MPQVASDIIQPRTPSSLRHGCLQTTYNITGEHSNQDVRWTPKNVISPKFNTQFGPDVLITMLSLSSGVVVLEFEQSAQEPTRQRRT